MFVDIVHCDDEGLGKRLGFDRIYNVKEFNVCSSKRKNFENKKVDIILDDVGLNHVLCKLAVKNKIAIGFSFNEVLRRSGKLRSKVINSMLKNVKLCRKYKVRMIIGSFAKSAFEMRGLKDLIAFGIVLGMNGGEAKKALRFKKRGWYDGRKV